MPPSKPFDLTIRAQALTLYYERKSILDIIKATGYSQGAFINFVTRLPLKDGFRASLSLLFTLTIRSELAGHQEQHLKLKRS